MLLPHFTDALPLVFRKHPINIHNDQQMVGVVAYAGDELLSDIWV
jgi:hypothetical protein